MELQFFSYYSLFGLNIVVKDLSGEYFELHIGNDDIFIYSLHGYELKASDRKRYITLEEAIGELMGGV